MDDNRIDFHLHILSILITRKHNRILGPQIRSPKNNVFVSFPPLLFCPPLLLWCSLWLLEKLERNSCCRDSWLISILLARLFLSTWHVFFTFLGFEGPPGYILTSENLELRTTSTTHRQCFSCKKNDTDSLIGMTLNHIFITLSHFYHISNLFS